MHSDYLFALLVPSEKECGTSLTRIGAIREPRHFMF